EVEPLAGLQEQTGEPVERDLRRLARRDEGLPHGRRRDAPVVRDNDNPLALGLPDPLPGRLRDPAEHVVLRAAGQREADAMAERLDLLDLVEPERREARRVVGRRRDLRVGCDDGDLRISEMLDDRAEALGRALRRLAGRDGPSREVGTPAADERPLPAEGERSIAVVEHEVVRRPAGLLPVVGPGARLEDVAARRIDGPLVPVDQVRLRRRPDRGQAASPPVKPLALPSPLRPWRRRAHQTRAPCARSYAWRPSGSRTRSHAPMYRTSRPPKPVLKWAIPPVARPHRS